MTIKIEITANGAEELAGKLHDFVQTFVSLARATEPTPFDKPVVTPVAANEEEAPKRRRKAAPVIDANADPEPEKPAKAPKKVSPDEVRDILNRLRSTKGNDALGAVVTQFAPKFSEIPESSYPAVYAAAEKALAA